jgi:uncharacterized protein (DUF427 family)
MQPAHSQLIRVVPHPARLRVEWNGHVIADTTEALVLYEDTHAGVRYIPRADVDMTRLRLSALVTRCPYKGEAFHFSLEADGAVAENAVWSYETPLPDAALIAGYLAFDARLVTFIDNNPA